MAWTPFTRLDHDRRGQRYIPDALYVKCRELEGRELQPSAAIIDSQSVKAGPNACEAVGYDAGKKVKGRKRHILTDTLGLLLKADVHCAGIQDRDAAARLFVQLTARFPFREVIFADRAQAGPKAQQAAPRPLEIVRRPGQRVPGPSQTLDRRTNPRLDLRQSTPGTRLRTICQHRGCL